MSDETRNGDARNGDARNGDARNGDVVSRALQSGAALAADPAALAERRRLPAYKTDPVVWAAERGVKIDEDLTGLAQPALELLTLLVW